MKLDGLTDDTIGGCLPGCIRLLAPVNDRRSSAGEPQGGEMNVRFEKIDPGEARALDGLDVALAAQPRPAAAIAGADPCDASVAAVEQALHGIDGRLPVVDAGAGRPAVGQELRARDPRQLRQFAQQGGILVQMREVDHADSHAVVHGVQRHRLRRVGIHWI